MAYPFFKSAILLNVASFNRSCDRVPTSVSNGRVLKCFALSFRYVFLVVFLCVVPRLLIEHLCSNPSPFGLHSFFRFLRNPALLVAMSPNGALVLRLKIVAVAVLRPELRKERLVVND